MDRLNAERKSEGNDMRMVAGGGAALVSRKDGFGLMSPEKDKASPRQG